MLSGDPDRKRLFDAIYQVYSKYNTISKVFLYFERNPAKAFNRASRESEADVIFCTGDVYMKEADISNMANQLLSGLGDVIFIVPPRFRGKEKILFVDAGFVVRRDTMLKNPMPEEPDFLEEVLWYNQKKDTLRFQPYFGIHYHLHRNTFRHIFRQLLNRYGERAKEKKRGRLIRALAFVKMFLDSIRHYIRQRMMPAPEEMLRRLQESSD